MRTVCMAVAIQVSVSSAAGICSSSCLPCMPRYTSQLPPSYKARGSIVGWLEHDDEVSRTKGL